MEDTRISFCHQWNICALYITRVVINAMQQVVRKKVLRTTMHHELNKYEGFCAIRAGCWRWGMQLKLSVTVFILPLNEADNTHEHLASISTVTVSLPSAMCAKFAPIVTQGAGASE